MNFFKNIFKKKGNPDWDAIKQSLDAKISGLKRPAVRLLKRPHKSRSKLGGRPFVEGEHFVWPESEGKPLAFLAQIDLAEISAQYAYDWLSSEGTLLFFYDVLTKPTGIDPKDSGKWRVLYQQSPDTLAEFPRHLDKQAQIIELSVTPTRVDIFPIQNNARIQQLNLSKYERDVYCDIIYDESCDHPHQVGGYPRSIQEDNMDLQSQLVSNGIHFGDFNNHQSPEADALEAGVNDWQLLLQFDSDEELDLMWEDVGILYFWVQKEEAKQNHFDNCWVVLQSC